MPVYIHERFKPLLCRSSTDHRLQGLSFLVPEIWSQIIPDMKNVKAMASFTYVLKKDIFLNLQTQVNSNHFITFELLKIIIFLPSFLYTSMETLTEIRTVWSFLRLLL